MERERDGNLVNEVPTRPGGSGVKVFNLMYLCRREFEGVWLELLYGGSFGVCTS